MTKIDFTPETKPTVDALVALHPSGDLAGGPLTEYDEALDGQLASLLPQERFTGKRKQQLRLHTLGRLPFARLMLLGTGAPGEGSPAEWISLGEVIGDAAAKGRWRSVAVIGLDGDPDTDALSALTRGVLQGGYRFDRHQTPDDGDDRPVELERLLFVGSGEQPAPERLVRESLLAEAVCFARDLVNEPAEITTPLALAEAAESIARDNGLACEVLDAKQCADLDMGLFLAVGRGSRLEPRFIHLTYTPDNGIPDSPVVALVGKGITFDSGGLSLKPSASMKDMKCDMAGAAAVLGAMRLVKAWNVPYVVHGIVPACENMPSGHAYRLGDVLRGMDGPTVEVVNTDAEGRLILADGISFARSKGCTQIIDLATLTGACVVALGPDIAGVMGPDGALVKSFTDASDRAGEATWRLPLPAALEEQLKSPVADCKNAGGRYGGALTAGLFLKKFAKDTPWLHVDIAGPAYADKARAGRPAGGTGFGVASLLAFLTREGAQS